MLIMWEAGFLEMGHCVSFKLIGNIPLVINLEWNTKVLPCYKCQEERVPGVPLKAGCHSLQPQCCSTGRPARGRRVGVKHPNT